MKIIKNIFLLIIILAGYNNTINAQVDNLPWCPNGATWVYQKTSFFGHYNIKLSYIKDTTINNLPTKVLRVSHISILGPGPLPNYSWTETEIHYEYYTNINDSIYRWHTNQFLFLYDFNATAGDKWVIHQNKDYSCPNTVLPSTDTFSIVSTSLQTYDNVTFETITGTDNGNWSIGGTIIKNIGSMQTPYPIPINNACYGIDGTLHLPIQLNCYYDHLRGNIVFNTPPYGDCSYTMTPIETIPTSAFSSEKINIYPNPTTSDIMVESKNIALESYAIYDLNGRLLEEKNIQTSNISLGEYPSGIYFLILSSTKNTKHPFKIVKQ